MIKADDYFVTWLDVGYVLIIVMPKNPLYIRMSSVVYMYRQYIHPVVYKYQSIMWRYQTKPSS